MPPQEGEGLGASMFPGAFTLTSPEVALKQGLPTVLQVTVSSVEFIVSPQGVALLED